MTCTFNFSDIKQCKVDDADLAQQYVIILITKMSKNELLMSQTMWQAIAALRKTLLVITKTLHSGLIDFMSCPCTCLAAVNFC